MNIYEELNLDQIINASDTYTRIGGSRMNQRTLEAMRQASEHFVDIQLFSDAICHTIAERTGNEAAFLSSGAGACVVLTACACMTLGDEALAYQLPDASRCPRNEIIVFESQKSCPVLPYWHLIELSGAKLVTVSDDLADLEHSINEKTAAIFFFAGTVYEWTTPEVSDIITVAHTHHIPVIIDAAAQLPPKSLMTYYTANLGADAVIFSGGKFINGPQTTGIVLGRHHIIDHCNALASPNVRIGRPYKVGKEEYAAFYRACMDFLDADEEKQYDRLTTILEAIQASLTSSPCYYSFTETHGRLGQQLPMLYLQFVDGTTGKECYDYMYAAPNRIDIGTFNPSDPTGDICRIFINPINLRETEVQVLVEKLNQFLNAIPPKNQVSEEGLL